MGVAERGNRTPCGRRQHRRRQHRSCQRSRTRGGAHGGSCHCRSNRSRRRCCGGDNGRGSARASGGKRDRQPAATGDCGASRRRDGGAPLAAPPPRRPRLCAAHSHRRCFASAGDAGGRLDPPRHRPGCPRAYCRTHCAAGLVRRRSRPGARVRRHAAAHAGGAGGSGSAAALAGARRRPCRRGGRRRSTAGRGRLAPSHVRWQPGALPAVVQRDLCARQSEGQHP